MKVYTFKNAKIKTETGLSAEEIAYNELHYGKLIGVYIKDVGFVKCDYHGKQIPVKELSIFKGKR